MISIIVPVYKSENSLPDCIRSIQNQTEKALEIILVEDGSPDNSGKICDDFAETDARIKVIHKKNAGVSVARNTGIDAATGEYVLFVDSDDYIEPTMCEKLLKAVAMDAADIAICGYHHHYQGVDVEKIPRISGSMGSENFLRLYGRGYINMPWNKMYRRKLMGRFNEYMSLGEDLLFNLDYLQKADEVAIVSEAFYHYIQGEAGTTLSTMERDDKLEIAKLLCSETHEFYEKLAGEPDTSGIINGRLISEVLDDIEALPFKAGMGKDEKLNLIIKYMNDAQLIKAAKSVKLEQLDYRMLHFCMKRKWENMTYFLCVLRAAIVKAVLKAKGGNS